MDWALVFLTSAALCLLLVINDTKAQQGFDIFQHEETLDPEGNYRLGWTVDWETDQIFFNVTVKTLGFIVFGIAKQDLNASHTQKTDLLIGGVDSQNGLTIISDHHAVMNDTPVVDTQQDWELHSSWENGSHTHLSFSRLLDTCDSQDIPINMDTTSLIWGYGRTDDTEEYQLAARGSVNRYLLDGDLTPKTIRHHGGRIGLETPHNRSDLQVWSLRSNLHLKSKRTTYWCHVHKLELPQKHHIIGFKFTIDNETKSNMHHMILFRCVMPNPSTIFEPLVNTNGDECFNIEQQIGKRTLQACSEITAGYAIGGLPFFLPDSVGVPVGGTGQAAYYILQTHYDNPEGRSDLVTDHTFDLYYTSILRNNDGGILSVGQNIPGSPSILLPPGTQDHKIYGHCSPTCTKKMFPDEGIKVVAALLHSHNAGRRMAIQHFRTNQELPYIYKDDNWKMDFQPVKLLREEVTVLPVDQLTVRCHYDTTYTNQTIVGGLATNQEMCKTFLFYYNKIENFSLSTCRSELISPEYTARYLAGVRNLTWDESKLEFVALDPPHLAGMSLSEISDSDYVNWSDEQWARLKRDQILLPQKDICLSDNEVKKIVMRWEHPEPTFVTYPLEASEYRHPNQCSMVS